jgi:hypothetical protein
VTEKCNIDRPAIARAEPRRKVLSHLAGGLLLPTIAGCADHDITSRSAGPRHADDRPAGVILTIDERIAGTPINSGYAGFSYEKSSLANNFFVASNYPLVRLFRRLGTGLLRLGGNSVDRTSWQATDAQQTGSTIGPSDIDALTTFLRESGWRAIYGINLATNSPALAAEEARYVARSLGRHLYAFEIGNEPDAYSFNGLRPPSYTYRDFLGEWNGFAVAVRQAAPHAALSGPASAWHETSWTVPFAQDEGDRVVLLTQHYYRANGLSPQSTLALLLAGDPALPSLLDPLRVASRAAGIRDGYRLTEANSFYDGGAPHISNTFGTALWAIDFLFANARHGSSGVNFHGGGASPGYTPIADDGAKVVEVRPEYYGMLLFSMMGAGRALTIVQSPTHLAFSAYGIAGQGRTCIMLVNKEPSVSIAVEIRPGMTVDTAEMNTLSAPTLGSVSGIMLNGASIEADGSWSPRPPATASLGDGSVIARVGAASAVLLVLR